MSINIQVGDPVKLRDTVTRFSVPEGRQNHRTATVLSLLSDIEGGLYLDRDLNGCRYWNACDVELVQ